jgi:hypothetical protein
MAQLLRVLVELGSRFVQGHGHVHAERSAVRSPVSGVPPPPI